MEWGQLTRLWEQEAKGNGVSRQTFNARIKAGYSLKDAAKAGKYPNSKPIERPSFFTETWYRRQKKRCKSDRVLWSELHVSRNVFNRWKKEVGITKQNGVGMKYLRPEFFTLEWYAAQKCKGVKDSVIRKQLFISSQAVLRRWKDEVGAY